MREGLRQGRRSGADERGWNLEHYGTTESVDFRLFYNIWMRQPVGCLTGVT
jgi:hypothetical protein